MLSWFKSLFSSKSNICVSIPVGDAFPNSDELAKRNAITDELEANNIGDFVGAGGGFNQMDFEYEVADLDAAKQLIAKTIEKHMPGQEYDVTVE